MRNLILTGFILTTLVHTACAGLVGYWKLDEGTGTLVSDSSGLGNHGNLVNAKANTWTNGHSGGGLYLDGTTGGGATYVTIPDASSLHITNAISFAGWIRCDDTGRDAPILDKEGTNQLTYWFGTFPTTHFGVLLARDNSGTWTVQNRSQGYLFPGIWVHIASTWDGTTIRHYINGIQLQQTAAFAGPLAVTTTPLIIGANTPFNATAYKGILDELRLYNHALSQAELTALAGVTPQMVGHWSFNEGGGTNVFDSSGQANHGTIVNLQTNTWTQGIQGSGLYCPGITGSNSTYVAVPDSASLRIAGDISFAAWVRCDDINRDAPILAKEGDGHLSYWFGAYGQTDESSGPGNFGVLLDEDGNQNWSTYDRNQGNIPQGQWVHLASVRSGSSIYHYFNGQLLPQVGTFAGPIHLSDAFLTIGENSLYNFRAFQGVIDEIYLYNYALSGTEIQALILGAAFKITSAKPEGNDLRLTWTCLAGRSYVVQTNSSLRAVGGFSDVGTEVAIPANFTGSTTNYLHPGILTNAQPVFYRVRLKP